METIVVTQPVGVKLEKNSKGYTYEISIKGDSIEAVLEQLAKAYLTMEEKYGNNQTGG